MSSNTVGRDWSACDEYDPFTLEAVGELEKNDRIDLPKDASDSTLIDSDLAVHDTVIKLKTSFGSLVGAVAINRI